MQAIWSQAQPAYAGRHAAFSGVQAHPQPVQRPWPRVIVGGRSPAAFRRAVSRAHGWYGFGLDPAGAAAALAGLREAAKQVPRPADLGPLEISLTPRGWGLERATAAEFAALGIQRLVLRAPRDLDAAGLEAFVGRCGDDLVGQV
jgi:alkanesulfonate monooxygenase SsuD/methylene tetrahydromethanopterin reductase-like flavin-dependent oxidoreductase (luciferase family)